MALSGMVNEELFPFDDDVFDEEFLPFRNKQGRTPNTASMTPGASAHSQDTCLM